MLGAAIFAGMLGVTFFRLLFTPVFYVVIEGLIERCARSTQRDPEGAAEAR